MAITTYPMRPRCGGEERSPAAAVRPASVSVLAIRGNLRAGCRRCREQLSSAQLSVHHRVGGREPPLAVAAARTPSAVVTGGRIARTARCSTKTIRSASVTVCEGDPQVPESTPNGTKLRLMAVHAHPDDESSKGAATMARYVGEGVRVVVATCTGGERGSVLNPK